MLTALVNKVLMPALGMLTGGIDFKDLKILLLNLFIKRKIISFLLFVIGSVYLIL